MLLLTSKVVYVMQTYEFFLINLTQILVLVLVITCYSRFYYLYRLQKDPPAGISAAPTEDDFFVWKAVIFG